MQIAQDNSGIMTCYKLKKQRRNYCTLADCKVPVLHYEHIANFTLLKVYYFHPDEFLVLDLTQTVNKKSTGEYTTFN
jgi:hypothetical protein